MFNNISWEEREFLKKLEAHTVEFWLNLINVFSELVILMWQPLSYLRNVQNLHRCRDSTISWHSSNTNWVTSAHTRHSITLWGCKDLCLGKCLDLWLHLGIYSVLFVSTQTKYRPYLIQNSNLRFSLMWTIPCLAKNNLLLFIDKGCLCLFHWSPHKWEYLIGC